MGSLRTPSLGRHYLVSIAVRPLLFSLEHISYLHLYSNGTTQLVPYNTTRHEGWGNGAVMAHLEVTAVHRILDDGVCSPHHGLDADGGRIVDAKRADTLFTMRTVTGVVCIQIPSPTRGGVVILPSYINGRWGYTNHHTMVPFPHTHTPFMCPHSQQAVTQYVCTPRILRGAHCCFPFILEGVVGTLFEANGVLKHKKWSESGEKIVRKW